MEPIGYYYSEFDRPYDLPRQPEEDDSEGFIELHSGKNFEQALEGIEGFSRIWIIFQFHHNEHWKPKTLPPRKSSGKIGVFATRSPYRPNSIGLSCVQLIQREGRKLRIKGADLMNETPILDLKPYVPAYDSFPQSSSGWLEGIEQERWKVSFSKLALEQIIWLQTQAQIPVKNFIQRQLEFDPMNSEKKRVQELSENKFVLSYKTWRIFFWVESKLRNIEVEKLGSGYSQMEISDPKDPYKDKQFHKEYLKIYPKDEGGY